jgi:hypothetical protein
MTLAERCSQLEARLRTLQSNLCPPDASRLERCEGELHEVIRLLTDCVVDERSTPDNRPAAQAALRQLRATTRQLRAQVEHGLNLCQGWAQVHVSAGYTDQGRPILAGTENNACYDA